MALAAFSSVLTSAVAELLDFVRFMDEDVDEFAAVTALLLCFFALLLLLLACEDDDFFFSFDVCRSTAPFRGSFLTELVLAETAGGGGGGTIVSGSNSNFSSLAGGGGGGGADDDGDKVVRLLAKGFLASSRCEGFREGSW